MGGRGTRWWIGGVLLAAGLIVSYRLGVQGTVVEGTGHMKAAATAGQTERKAPHAHTNRLIGEASPYLLQHAHNPVDWYAWGPEAFEKARGEDKPVFLSIGYSTCHWCHVMEAESFEDEATAVILNEHFVAIKVDREERPDVDGIYMKAVQMMTGSGGWPLSAFLTPEGKPFYGGTYFPPKAMYGRPSFQQVLLAIAEAWRDKRDGLLESAQKIEEVLQETGQGETTHLSRDALKKAFEQLAGAYDPVHGGFGAAPKFPQPSGLMMLLNYWRRTGNNGALKMVTKTLDKMALGGIHDHLGGGFHRYSTDGHWLVPHFEKMLYDQALLGKVYVQAYQATGREAYAAVARDIFDYVLRDMTDGGGGFYAAEDADSEGREGVFYVWEAAEIDKLLGKDAAKLFAAAYGVTRQGNFEGGHNILHIVRTKDELAKEFGRSTAEIEADLDRARTRLFDERNTRQRPHRDDKIITGWNGLMISALAYGGAALGQRRYVDAAEKAADFVLTTLRQDGRLMRYVRDGRVVEEGFLDDYAFLTLGLVDLYEASFDAKWLAEAQGLADQMIDLFGDKEQGGFFLAGRDDERLISRDKPSYDGAVPSGNSVAALALLKLGRLTVKERFGAEGQRVLEAFSGSLSRSPTAQTAMLLALDFQLGPTQEIVIAGSDESDQAGALVHEARRHFLPSAVLMLRLPGREGDPLTQVTPFVAALGPVEGRAAAYVCENYTCRRPVTTAAELAEILAGAAGTD